MTLIEMERAQELVLSAPAPQATGLRREHFIPISRSELIHRLSETAGKETGTVIGEAASAFDLFRYLAAWRHLGYCNRLSRLNDSWSVHPCGRSRSPSGPQNHPVGAGGGRIPRSPV
jgi:hypothetical protein